MDAEEVFQSGATYAASVGDAVDVQTFESKCGQCGTALVESPNATLAERKPCPACGSTRRTFTDGVTESAQLREQWRMKAKRPGHKRPIYEDVSGDEYHRDSGRWHIVQRSIDQLKKWYYEKITDAETGAVVRECDESLGEHTGRGAARFKKNK